MRLKTPLASIFDAQNSDSSGARWMVVDNDPEALDSLTLLLAGLKRAEVYKFRSGEEALNCFALYPGGFELVIAGFALTGLSGVELCRRMLDISPASIIILSAASVFTSEQFARRAGFSGLLQKPYSANELCRVLKSVLPGIND